MKNIHILPTDKPSRLYQTRNNPLILDSKFENGTANRHIYITSDEEIKEGDWYLTFLNREVIGKPIRCEDSNYNFSGCEKIILTTDQDLIKDGVQAIDDEFLEWFVKNPSCESVEVEINYKVKSGTIQEHKEGLAGYEYYEYEIIIPQEEPKDVVLGYKTSLDAQMLDKIEPKQETIEEAAKLYIGVPITRIIDDEERYYTSNIGEYDAFIQGAKWQQERMYSEEEVIIILNKFGSNVYGNYTRNEMMCDFVERWFEQFKKK